MTTGTPHSSVEARTDSDRAAKKDWYEWHRPYEDSGSRLSRRLAVVQRDIEDWLDGRQDGELTIVSLCAGQGRDVLGVLRRRDAERVRAYLVETDERNVRDAQAALQEFPSVRGEIWRRDAAAEDTYRDLPKADLLLLAGIFGNLSNDDVQRTICAAPLYCNPRATVIWTRGRWEPDLTGAIRHWFEESGFAEQRFDSLEDSTVTVGVHLLTNLVTPAATTWPLFRFLSH